MKFYDGLLTGSSRCKRGLLDAGLRLTGNYESMHHLMIGRKPAATCADSNLRLKSCWIGLSLRPKAPWRIS